MDTFTAHDIVVGSDTKADGISNGSHTIRNYGFARVATNIFLSMDIVEPDILKALVEALISRSKLSRLGKHKCMPMSSAYFEQLHIWQTICLLTPKIEFSEPSRVLHDTVELLKEGFIYGIRQLMDLFAIQLILAYPQELIVEALSMLSDPALPAPALSSMSIIMMLSTDQLLRDAATKEILKKQFDHLLCMFLPLCVSPVGLVRVSIQYSLRQILGEFPE